MSTKGHNREKNKINKLVKIIIKKESPISTIQTLI